MAISTSTGVCCFYVGEYMICTDNMSHESCACVHNVPKFPTDHSAFSDCSKITILEQSLNAE